MGQCNALEYENTLVVFLHLIRGCQLISLSVFYYCAFNSYCIYSIMYATVIIDECPAQGTYYHVDCYETIADICVTKISFSN